MKQIAKVILGDVLEIAAVKIDKDYKILDKFHRYYLSRYPVNYFSYAVHRLNSWINIRL